MSSPEYAATSWMIRNDGWYINTVNSGDIYGDISNPEATLLASEWLYNNTRYELTKISVIRFIVSWLYSVRPHYPSDRANYLKSEIESRPYTTLSLEFVDSHADEIESCRVFSEQEYNLLVCELINQEFLRARYGGLYESHQTGELAFRLSSINFDWIDIIHEFVQHSECTHVTIAADKNSTQLSDRYYSWNGDAFNQVFVADFLSLYKSYTAPYKFRSKLFNENLDKYGLAKFCEFSNIPAVLEAYNHCRALQIFNNLVAGDPRDN